jgi:hypothetical protein
MPHPTIMMALEAGIAIIAVALMGTVLISRVWHRPKQGKGVSLLNAIDSWATV